MTSLVGRSCFAHISDSRQREKRKGKNTDWISGVLDALHSFPEHLCGFEKHLSWRARHCLWGWHSGSECHSLKGTDKNKPNSLPCQNYVMNATLPTPVGLRPSCKSVSLESYWVHLRNTDPVPVVRPGICIEYISQVILMYGLFGVTNLSFNTKLGHGIKDPSQSGPSPSP